MEKPWEKPFENREEIMNTLGPMGLGFHICWWLGIVFVLMGVVSDAINMTIGLESISWLLLAIATFMAGIPMLLTWALAMHLLSMEARNK